MMSRSWACDCLGKSIPSRRNSSCKGPKAETVFEDCEQDGEEERQRGQRSGRVGCGQEFGNFLS